MPAVAVTDFEDLPHRRLGEVALARAAELGVEHADFRFERIRYQHLGARDGVLQASSEHTGTGFAVRVVSRGAWGFAAGVVLTDDEARRVATTAVEVAALAAPMTREPVRLAPEPTYDDVRWAARVGLDPFSVPTRDKAALLVDWTERLRAHDAVDHATADVQLVAEDKYYADLAGTRTTQHRVRVDPQAEAMGTDPGSGVFDSMRTLAPPTARGWEYLLGDGHDWDSELAGLGDLLAEKLRAPSVEAGPLDLVIHPSNLWLTIHESIGHATELDRALGYEANYAGTSFATPDLVGSLRYGSPVMHVTGDRTEPHGLATTGWDDEGVATTRWDLVRDGILVGFQLDRSMAAAMPHLAVDGGRSNGCAYADSPGHVPLQRMANVSLQPAAGGPSTAELIGRVERGLYVVGDRSWSIDMQRFNFQFTGQQFHRIVDGELAGQVRDVAYQATTTDFWGAMEAVGGPQTWELGGAFNCGKAQPGQVAAVSHGCPTALFRGIRVLNTSEEGA